MKGHACALFAPCRTPGYGAFKRINIILQSGMDHPFGTMYGVLAFGYRWPGRHGFFGC